MRCNFKAVHAVSATSKMSLATYDDTKASSKTEVVASESVPVPTEDDVVYPTGLKLVIIISALMLAVLLVALDQTIIATAIPTITDRFNSVSDIGWYGSVRSFLQLCDALANQLLKFSGVFLDHDIAATHFRPHIQDF